MFPFKLISLAATSFEKEKECQKRKSTICFDYKLSELILWLLDRREIRCRFHNECLQFNPLGLLACEKRVLRFLLCDIKIKGNNRCEQIDREETAQEDEHREEQREVLIAVFDRAGITGIDEMPEVIWPTLER